MPVNVTISFQKTSDRWLADCEFLLSRMIDGQKFFCLDWFESSSIQSSFWELSELRTGQRIGDENASKIIKIAHFRSIYLTVLFTDFVMKPTVYDEIDRLTHAVIQDNLRRKV